MWSNSNLDVHYSRVAFYFTFDYHALFCVVGSLVGAKNNLSKDEGLSWACTAIVSFQELAWAWSIDSQLLHTAVPLLNFAILGFQAALPWAVKRHMSKSQ